jgi:hypothetical protein
VWLAQSYREPSEADAAAPSEWSKQRWSQYPSSASSSSSSQRVDGAAAAIANPYGMRTFYENRADWLAINTVYELVREKHRGAQLCRASEQFFVANAQLWCVDEPRSQVKSYRSRVEQVRSRSFSSSPEAILADQLVHGMAYHRVNMPLSLLSLVNERELVEHCGKDWQKRG